MRPLSIFNLSTIDAARRADGGLAVASFDAVLAGVRLAGCIVVEQQDRTLVAEPPAAKTRSGRDRLVRIVDPGLDREFQAAALAAFRAVTKGAFDAA